MSLLLMFVFLFGFVLGAPLADAQQAGLAGLAAAKKVKADKPAADKPAKAKKDADEDDEDQAADDGADDDESSDDQDEDADADESDDEADDDEEEEQRETFTVEPKRLKVDVTLDATFAARNTAEVKLDPKSWSSFKIEEVVEHGATVNEGDVLVKFDRESLDEAIAELDLTLRVGEITLARAEAELPRLEETLDMQLESAERSSEYAKQDLDEYKENGRDLQLLSMDLSWKQFQMALDNARDELEQLQKMYDADDLTEETEEIVLRRQRQLVEIYEAYAGIIEYDDERSRSVFLPRSDLRREESLKRVDMSLDRTKLSHKLDLKAARYKLEKQRKAREKSLEKHSEMVEDRGLMKVKAPMAGVVYYGRAVNGKWSDLSGMLTKLLPEKSVSKGQVLMTIVDPSELYLYGTVSEKHLPSVEQGQPARVWPAAEGSDPMKGVVAEVSAVPVASGKYAVEVELKTDDLPEWLDPGMTGKVKITTYDNKKALLVPKKAVHTDEFDETEKHVWLVVEEDGETEVKKRRVRVGHAKGDDVEVLKGLKRGDVISLEDEDKDDEDED